MAEGCINTIERIASIFCVTLLAIGKDSITCVRYRCINANVSYCAMAGVVLFAR